MSIQIKNYTNKKEAMKNDEIYNDFTNFLNKYKEYFPNYLKLIEKE